MTDSGTPTLTVARTALRVAAGAAYFSHGAQKLLGGGADTLRAPKAAAGRCAPHYSVTFGETARARNGSAGVLDCVPDR